MTVIDHIRENEMESFCAGGLSVSATIKYAEHLEVCSECSRLFRQVSTADRTRASSGVLFSPEVWILGRHLDYEQLSGYLEGEVSPDQLPFIRLHLELCPGCSQDLANLR